MKQNDGLPQLICKICADKFIEFRHFRLVFRESDSKLRSLIKSQVKTNARTDIECVSLDSRDEFSDVEYLDANICDDDNNSKLINEPSQYTLKLEIMKSVDFSGEKSKKPTCAVDFVPLHTAQRTEKQYSCNLCDKTFKTQELLRKHSVRHDINAFRCRICPKVFARLVNLKWHIQNIHNLSPEENCAVDLLASGIPEGSNNLNRKSDGTSCKSETIDNGKVCLRNRKLTQQKCPHCPRVFLSSLKSNLFRHIQEVHRSRSQETEGMEDSTMNQEKIIFECLECHQRFTDPIDLYEHSKVHRADKMYETIEGHNTHCELCRKHLQTTDAYVAHMGEQHNQQLSDIHRFKCHWCDSRAKTRQGLYIHIRCNHSNGPDSRVTKNLKCRIKQKQSWLCTICRKVSTTKYYAEIHSRIHSGERPFSCGVCSKTFNTPATLKVHSRIHTGERPYQCSICTKSFTQKPHLLSHKMTHTNAKVNICDICGKQFNLKRNLIVHKYCHTGQYPYACDYGKCKKTFNRKNKLRTHQILEHEAGRDV